MQTCRRRRQRLHLMPQERATARFILLLWILEASLLLLVNGRILLSQKKTDQFLARSLPATTPSEIALLTWPATWTPIPTSTPTDPAPVVSQPRPISLPEACYVTSPTNLGQMLYPLDCEITALWYLVQTQPRYRSLVDREALYNALVYHENPDRGFRGDMHGPRPGDSDRNYGLHARALVEVGQHAGIPLEVIRSIQDMKDRLCRGEPVIAWMRSTQGRQAPVLVRGYQDSNGMAYYTVAYEHAVLVMGYDEATVSYLEPADGQAHTITWRQFEQEIRLFGKQMVAVSQAGLSP